MTTPAASASASPANRITMARLDMLFPLCRCPATLRARRPGRIGRATDVSPARYLPFRGHSASVAARHRAARSPRSLATAPLGHRGRSPPRRSAPMAARPPWSLATAPFGRRGAPRALIASSGDANMCSMSVVCVLLPRFELVVAAGARAALLSGPAALAPEPGREQFVGEVSAAAEEGFGIHPGMRMGEALARYPRLALVPPDPVGVADAWGRVLRRLEATGALVEPGHPGLACFDARGLQRMHGGSLEGVLTVAHAALHHRIPPSAESGTGGLRPRGGPPRLFADLGAPGRARPRPL